MGVSLLMSGHDCRALFGGRFLSLSLHATGGGFPVKGSRPLLVCGYLLGRQVCPWVHYGGDLPHLSVSVVSHEAAGSVVTVFPGPLVGVVRARGVVVRSFLFVVGWVLKVLGVGVSYLVFSLPVSWQLYPRRIVFVRCVDVRRRLWWSLKFSQGPPGSRFCIAEPAGSSLSWSLFGFVCLLSASEVDPFRSSIRWLPLVLAPRS